MDATLATTIVSTSGAVLVAIAGLAANTFWVRYALGKLGEQIDKLDHRLDRLEDRMTTQFDHINGKLASLDTEVGKLMDKIK